jgi:amidase
MTADVQELLWLDATAQAKLIADRQVRPRDLVEAAIARIEAVDGRVNAVIHRRFEKALAEVDAGLPPGPFHGVPFLIKDLNAESAGDPAHQGNAALKAAGWTASSDSWLVARYRRAGFAFLGRTNTPEFGILPITEPHAYGPTRNPYNLAHSPGGSSGGSAAAVAAGMVAVAHASDGGGSIRIPSSMCGLVGLKPSRGRMTLGPWRDESDLSVQHVVCRSVRDTAALLDVGQGPGLGDIAVAPPPVRSYVEELQVQPKGLRIAMTDTNPSAPVHPDCVAAVRAAANLLDSLGHHVSEEAPQVDPETARRFMVRWVVKAKMSMDSVARQLGRELTSQDVEPLTWAMAQTAASFSALQYADALDAGVSLTRQVGAFWADHDLLLTPTLGGLAPKVGELEPPPNDPMSGQRSVAELVPFTPQFNVTGQPAMSLPLHVSPTGLPVGVQLVAAYGREDLLIQVAGQLEQAAPWAARRPSL